MVTSLSGKARDRTEPTDGSWPGGMTANALGSAFFSRSWPYLTLRGSISCDALDLLAVAFDVLSLWSVQTSKEQAMKESNMSSVVDEARRELCRLVVEACEQGAVNVKVRVNLDADGQPAAVWVYGHLENAWRKLTTTIGDRQVAAAIAGELDRLASAPHADECSLRRQEVADRIEVEIKFHRDAIDSHRGENLGSYLFGILFYENKSDQQSRRKTIRRGPQAYTAKR